MRNTLIFKSKQHFSTKAHLRSNKYMDDQYAKNKLLVAQRRQQKVKISLLL